tara:strand:- start:50 stop:3226 length:3177 start_codon:yes stop_codon:yes gene_type:complete
MAIDNIKTEDFDPSFLGEDRARQYRSTKRRALRPEPTGTLHRYADLTLGGFSEAVAEIAGLPSEGVSALLRRAGFDIGSEQPLGQNQIKEAFDVLGLLPESKPKNLGERMAHRIGREGGYVAPLMIPGVGWGVRAANLAKLTKLARTPITGPLRRTRTMLRNLVKEPEFKRGVGGRTLEGLSGPRKMARKYFEKIGADPFGAIKRESMYTAAAGAGAQTGQEIFPGSITADIAGQVLGPIALGSISYFPTPFRIGRRLYSRATDSLSGKIDEATNAAMRQMDPRVGAEDIVPGTREYDRLLETKEQFRRFYEVGSEVGLDLQTQQYFPDDKRLQTMIQAVNFDQEQILAIANANLNNKEAIIEAWSKMSPNFGSSGIVSTMGPKGKRKVESLTSKIDEDILKSEKEYSDTLGGQYELSTGEIREVPIQRMRAKGEIGKKQRNLYEKAYEEDFATTKKLYDETSLNKKDIDMPVEFKKPLEDIALEYDNMIRRETSFSPAIDQLLLPLVRNTADAGAYGALRQTYMMINKKLGQVSRSSPDFQNSPKIARLAEMLEELKNIESQVGMVDVVPQKATKAVIEAQPGLDIQTQLEKPSLWAAEQLEPYAEGKFLGKDGTVLNPDMSVRREASSKWWIDNFREKWRTGFPTGVLKKGYGNIYRIQAENVAGAFWNDARDKGASRVGQYFSIFGEEGRPHFEAYVMDQLHQYAVKDGILDPNKVAKFVDKHWDKLVAADINPESFLLKQADLSKNISKRLKSLEKRKEIVEKSRMVALLKDYFDVNVEPIEVINKALKDKTGNSMRSLASIYRKDPEGLKGLQGTVWDIASQIESSAKLAGFIEDNKVSLSVLFPKPYVRGISKPLKKGGTGRFVAEKVGVDHMENMQKILMAKQMHEAAFDPTGVVREPSIKQFEQFMGQSIPAISNQVWTFYSRFLPKRIIVARMLTAFFTRMQGDRWNDALKEFFKNPDISGYMGKLLDPLASRTERLTSLRRLHVHWLNIGQEWRQDIIKKEQMEADMPKDQDIKMRNQARNLLDQIDRGDFKNVTPPKKSTTEFQYGQ